MVTKEKEWQPTKKQILQIAGNEKELEKAPAKALLCCNAYLVRTLVRRKYRREIVGSKREIAILRMLLDQGLKGLFMFQRPDYLRQSPTIANAISTRFTTVY